MTTALLAMSHSPLLDYVDPPADVKAAVDESFAVARKFANDFDPDLVVTFGPDHYNGFFYELMPPYCIGYEALSIGDYGSQAGALNVPTEEAKGLAEYVLSQGIDTAVSLRMEVDHGAVQPLEILFGDIAAKPVVPVFINSVAPPFVPINRVRRLGQAVGEYFAQSDKKVLFIASGGLSHDPPVPRIATATPEQRAFLLGGGRHLTPEARDERQQRVITAGKAFAKGEADIMDLAPEWDKELMEILASGDLSPLDAWTTEWMTEVAGNSSHEVRTWIAAYSAMGACGAYTVNYSFYKPIPEYIAGFGVTTVIHA
ncbi:3-carboxyethylcatechol 2,3-dioxygenase [Klugiella xanthotipulae]|uniref:2,3-dihydroxyphenylpropionate/2,3-dihydroxicinnamic acid 1,2-dioxygenase n=1 Tax=Klugiella xanthotipulae TaxID=244735 RepID=A0A543HXV7_9MICO|nr:3-carboxyethylcatechol 2,3-dioxygenase [Klugiella xanthotipulae]TQM63100.1 2,3-dihydroxyphenylpropionate 1,2-dioxygenase [Klugiella xanthotipulae]